MIRKFVFVTKDFTILRNIFQLIEIEITTTTALKSPFNYSPMWEGNTCIAKPNLEALSLK